MSNIFFFNKFDTRKLLLNYADNFAPLSEVTYIKNKEFFYDPFEHQVMQKISAAAEL